MPTRLAALTTATVATIATFAAFALTTGTANAQQYPNKQIRLIVGFAPGGGTDLNARIVAPKLAEALGQSVVIDNRPGAGGTIGAALAAKAPADGYTLVMSPNGPHAIAPALYPSLPYDVFKDFEPITLVSDTPYVLVTHPTVEAANARDFAAWLRTRPAPEPYSSAGNGTPAHLAAALFGSMTKTKISHVPYKGAAPGLTAVIAGEVKWMFSEISVCAQHVKAGKVKALAISSLTRSPLMPDLPTVNESGLTGFETTVWQALYAPTGTPRDIITQLNAATRKVLALPDSREKFAALGAVTIPGSPAELTSVMKRDVEKWGTLIREAGIKAE